jgi:hypothetical protein
LRRWDKHIPYTTIYLYTKVLGREPRYGEIRRGRAARDATSCLMIPARCAVEMQGWINIVPVVLVMSGLGDFFAARETVRVGDFFWGEVCDGRNRDGALGAVVKGAGAVGHLRGGLGDY